MTFIERYEEHLLSLGIIFTLFRRNHFSICQVRLRVSFARSLRKSEKIMRTVVDNLAANIYMKDTTTLCLSINI